MLMKRLDRLGIWLAAALVLSPGSAAAQTPPAGVTITYVEEHCPSDVAAFVATGGIEDSGSATITVLSPPAGPFGVTGSALHVEAVFVGAQGTFTLLWHVAFMATDEENVFTSVGAWRIVNGTGAYTELEGQGQSRGTCEFGFGGETDILVGRVR